MKTIYTTLFSVQVQHGYYASERPGGDVEIVPTPDTARMLRDRAFRCRPIDSGVAVYAEVTSTDPQPDLRRPVGSDGVRFAFVVRARSPHLGGVTDLPTYRPGRQVFCFDNLRSDVDGGDLLLGDSLDDSRVGPAVGLETRPTLLYEIDPPTQSTVVRCTDRFGAERFAVAVDSPDPVEPLDEARIAEWDDLPPGRYTVSDDDSGGSVELYKGSGIERGAPLGIVEIFDRTDGMAEDGVDRVPTAYRFLAGDQVTPVAYTVRLEARATTWKYVVVNKFQPEELDVADLEIESDPASSTFTRQIDGDRAIFTADAPRELRQEPTTLRLRGRYGTGPVQDLLDLPSPDASSPLEAGATETELVSAMYVYV